MKKKILNTGCLLVMLLTSATRANERGTLGFFKISSNTSAGISEQDLEAIKDVSRNYRVTNVSKPLLVVDAAGRSAKAAELHARDGENGEHGGNGSEITVVAYHVEDGIQLLFFKGKDFSSPTDSTFVGGKQRIILHSRGGKGGDMISNLKRAGFFSPPKFTNHKAGDGGNAGNIRFVALDSQSLEFLRGSVIASEIDWGNPVARPIGEDPNLEKALFVLQADGGMEGKVIKLINDSVVSEGSTGKGAQVFLVDASDTLEESSKNENKTDKGQSKH